MLLFFHDSNDQQNYSSVELWWEKIEDNPRRSNTEPSMDFRKANTEPSMDFRKANTEPSIDFRKANMEPSIHFRRANTETYYKYYINLKKELGRVGFSTAGKVAPRDFPRAPPSGKPLEKPCQPLENPVLPSTSP